jgi:hypothetical protein
LSGIALASASKRAVVFPGVRVRTTRAVRPNPVSWTFVLFIATSGLRGWDGSASAEPPTNDDRSVM